MSWTSLDNGASIGKRGTEEGTILRDEAHTDGARITLKRGGLIAPFSITCGIYGWMAHTCFSGAQQEAESEYERMKDRLAEILDLIPFEDDPDLERKQYPVSNAISKFVEEHW